MKIRIGKLTIELKGTISWEKPFMKRVYDAIRQGRKLEAIKIYKDNTGMGLKDSKDFIDSIWEQYYIQSKSSIDELVSFQAEQFNK